MRRFNLDALALAEFLTAAAASLAVGSRPARQYQDRADFPARSWALRIH